MIKEELAQPEKLIIERIAERVLEPENPFTVMLIRTECIVEIPLELFRVKKLEVKLE